MEFNIKKRLQEDGPYCPKILSDLLFRKKKGIIAYDLYLKISLLKYIPKYSTCPHTLKIGPKISYKI